MKFVKRILFFISIFAVYLIGKELLNLYISLKALDIYLAISFLLIIVIVALFYVLFPIIKILYLPKFEPPTKDAQLEPLVIYKRIRQLKKNKYLRELGFDLNEMKYDHSSYLKYIEKIKVESKKKEMLISKRHLLQLHWPRMVLLMQ